MVRDLYLDFDFFLLNSKSLFFFKGIFGVMVFRLPCVFFKKHMHKGKIVSFIFSDAFSFSSFLGNFFRLYNSLHFFFSRLKLHGLGYRFKLFGKSLVRIFMGATNYIFFHCPFNILLRVRRRRLLLVSNSLSLLRLVIVNMLLLKVIIPYALRGVFFPRQIVLLKPGKKKF